MYAYFVGPRALIVNASTTIFAAVFFWICIVFQARGILDFIFLIAQPFAGAYLIWTTYFWLLPVFILPLSMLILRNRQISASAAIPIVGAISGALLVFAANRMSANEWVPPSASVIETSLGAACGLVVGLFYRFMIGWIALDDSDTGNRYRIGPFLGQFGGFLFALIILPPLLSVGSSSLKANLDWQSLRVRMTITFDVAGELRKVTSVLELQTFMGKQDGSPIGIWGGTRLFGTMPILQIDADTSIVALMRGGSSGDIISILENAYDIPKSKEKRLQMLPEIAKSGRDVKLTSHMHPGFARVSADKIVGCGIKISPPTFPELAEHVRLVSISVQPTHDRLAPEIDTVPEWLKRLRQHPDGRGGYGLRARTCAGRGQGYFAFGYSDIETGVGARHLAFRKRRY